MKDRRIYIRVTEPEHKEITSKAKYLGITRSRLLLMGVSNVQGMNFAAKKEFMSRLHQLRLQTQDVKAEANIKVLRNEVAELCQLLNLLMADVVDLGN